MPTTRPSLRHFILTGFRRILDPDEIVTWCDTDSAFAPSITHFCVPADIEESLELLHDLRRRHLPGHWRVPYGFFKLFGVADQKVALVPRPWDRNRKHNVGLRELWAGRDIGQWMTDMILLPYTKTVTR
jgi:hypothetical protein